MKDKAGDYTMYLLVEYDKCGFRIVMETDDIREARRAVHEHGWFCYSVLIFPESHWESTEPCTCGGKSNAGNDHSLECPNYIPF